MLMVAQGATMPSLNFEMLRVASGSGTILTKADQAGMQSVDVGGFEVPTDRNGQVWVHFARRDPSIYVSAVDVLEDRVPPERIAQKLVLIGTSAVGLLDIKTTPVDPVMPGVEIHAQVLESVLTRAVLTQPNYAIAAEFFFALVLGLLVIAFAPMFGPVTLVAVGALFATVLMGTSWYFYTQHRLLIDFTYPLASTTSIYLTLLFSSFVREQKQRRQIRSAFGQYLSPALIEQLAQSPEKLQLGGEEREMTIMFSDVRGFTTISESYKHDPQGLTALMNRFLTPLTNAILDRKGTIDKYMGDAIMAFWNAPLDDKQHEINACEAALDMLERIDELNQEREIEAQDGGHVYIPINVGVGLNTGVCVVGNMGSNLRFDYSVLGDSVNLASRLEGQSKEYGFPIIIGSKTAMAVKDRFAILELDFIMVKGKTAARGDLCHRRPRGHRAVRKFPAPAQPDHRDAGVLSQPRLGRRAAAIERGRKSDDGHALEYLYDLYEARITGYQENPPPARLERRVRAADEVASATNVLHAQPHPAACRLERGSNGWPSVRTGDARLRGVSTAREALEIVGWAKRSVPTISYLRWARRKRAFAHLRRPALLQPDRGQVLKPVLRLHELLHLGRQRVRVGVVHHPHQRGVVDDHAHAPAPAIHPAWRHRSSAWPRRSAHRPSDSCSRPS